MKRPLKILLIDDHTIFRQGLKLLLENEDNLKVVGEAGTADEALAKAGELKPDLLLLDISLPGRSGVFLIKDFLKIDPGFKIIILTMYENNTYLEEALKAGAKGYVIKKAAEEELVKAIKLVREGNIYIHPALTREFVEKNINPPATKEEVSPREKEVLIFLARGFINKEIGVKLNISTKTVETYRGRIAEKLNLSGRNEYLDYVIKKGWFNPEIDCN